MTDRNPEFPLAVRTSKGASDATGCGVRYLSHVRLGRSPIHGSGVLAVRSIPARRKLGELTGQLARARAAEDAQRWAPRIYYVDVGGGWALDCRKGNLFKRLNHSCDGNCYLRVIRRRVEVYSKRRIAPGEELTVDYVATPHPEGMQCRCGSEKCRGLL